jgi:hypothetical protein
VSKREEALDPAADGRHLRLENRLPLFAIRRSGRWDCLLSHWLLISVAGDALAPTFGAGEDRLSTVKLRLLTGAIAWTQFIEQQDGELLAHDPGGSRWQYLWRPTN